MLRAFDSKKIIVIGVVVLILSVIQTEAFAGKAPTTSKILFTSVRDGNYEVYIMNTDGSHQVNLTQNRADDFQAVWAPTGEQILFVSDRDGGTHDLYLMNPDGSDIRRVFKRKRRINRSNPSWAPDGKQIAYSVRDWNCSRSIIYIATLGKEKEMEFVMDATDPAWSPDGSGIACSIEERLTFVNLRTRARKQFLPKKAIQWQRHSSWSATSHQLVFSGNNHAVPVDRQQRNEWMDKNTIFIINRNGTGLRQLVDEAGPYAWSPELSPDGREVLYTQGINGAHQILKINVHSGRRTRLTDNIWNFGGDWFDPEYALPVAPQPYLLTTTWVAAKTQPSN
ncbi:hypothetical protein F4055_01815 [Candidatus Poribacteria bacterium]|nr:hypothetical protein [Candidatus Poribacteria bacterium]